jgi:AraC family transcriptional regulator
MTITSTLTACGPGWRVEDVICTARPGDRAFEEKHDGFCIAITFQGSFRYRTTQGETLLAPGALLLGNDQHCFECGHAHSAGDRCLSFHYTSEFFEGIAAETTGARQLKFALPRVPPLASLIGLLATAEAAQEGGDADELQDVSLRLAGAVIELVANGREPRRAPSALDERRVVSALRRIEKGDEDSDLSLPGLAQEASMSPYHFLRTFRAIVGMTPHQFVLRTRLHRAAARLLQSNETITKIAFEAGFGDLSTFNHRFRRVLGMTPASFRATGSGQPSKKVDTL